MGQIRQIKINDVDVTPYVYDYEMNVPYGTVIKSISLDIVRNVAEIYPTLEEDYDDLYVEIKQGVDVDHLTEWVFRGYIRAKSVLGGIITFTAHDPQIRFVDKSITKTFNYNIDSQQGKISEIFKYMCDYSVVPYSSASIQDSGTDIILKTFYCKGNDVLERNEKLADLLDWQFYYNFQTGLEYFEPLGLRNNTTVLQVGVNVLTQPEWTYDPTKKVRLCKLFGGPISVNTEETFVLTGETEITLDNTPESVTLYIDDVLQKGGVEDQTPDATYYVDRVNSKIKFPSPVTGTVRVPYSFVDQIALVAENPNGHLEVEINREDLITVSDCEQYLSTYMDRHSVDFISTTILVNAAGLQTGQRIRVIDPYEGIDQYFLITNVKKRYKTDLDEVKIGTEQIQEENWNISVEDRLKLIEDKLSSEGGTVRFLKNLSAQIIHKEDWLKFEKTTISGTVLTWNNILYGTWNSTTWGPRTSGATTTTQYVTQNGEYTEDFVDTAFEGSGTAVWSTSGLDFS